MNIIKDLNDMPQHTSKTILWSLIICKYKKNNVLRGFIWIKYEFKKCEVI